MKLYIIFLFFLILGCKTKWEVEQEIINKVRSMPKEDVLKIPEVREYLSKNNVYISLTTNPKRIAKIHFVLKTIDKSLIKEIILSIPMKYGRGGESYNIPKRLESYPKLKIIRIEKDMGPITKLIPGIRYLREKKEENSILITIDDDTAYPIGMVGQIIKHMVMNDKSVFGGSTQPVFYWGLDTARWPDPENKNVAEGFGAIGYKPKYVDDKLMLDIVARQQELQEKKTCYLSDDLVLSYALAVAGIKREQIKNKFFSRIPVAGEDIGAEIIQFGYGYEGDALHRDAGGGSFSSASLNAKKYQHCYNFIVNKYKTLE